MNGDFLKNDPMRRPQWRSERVMKMLGHLPKPLRARSSDDHEVRIYKRFVKEYSAVHDDEARRDQVSISIPHVSRAHFLYYSPEIELRQILEARLLTSESIEDIARRFAVDPKVIEYFEKIFFNVRDRMDNTDWIRKVILGDRKGHNRSSNGGFTAERRGVAYRTFAYFGGAIALDAGISGVGTIKMPQSREDLDKWFEQACGQLVRTKAAAAACVLTINRTNTAPLIRLGLLAKNSAPSVNTASGAQSEELAAKILAKIGGNMPTALP